jgi:hypothetical protein
MLINIPHDCPTSAAKALAALEGLVVEVHEDMSYAWGDYVVEGARETDPFGQVDLLIRPIGPPETPVQQTIVYRVTPDTVVTVY